VLNVATMSEVVLQGPGVVAVVGELESAGVPEHVRAHVESTELIRFEAATLGDPAGQ
jgi:hypothetical protein